MDFDSLGGADLDTIFPPDDPGDLASDPDEFMDGFSQRLRRKLRAELLPRSLVTSESLEQSAETVDHIIGKIEKLGLRSDDFELNRIRPADIAALTDIQQKLDDLPVLCGYLEKLSPKTFAGFQRRWVVVRDYTMYWAKSAVKLEGGNAPLTERQKKKFVNRIPLVTVGSIVPDRNKASRFIIRAQDQRKGQVRDYTWRIPAGSPPNQRKRWIEGLEKHRNHLQLCIQWISMTSSISASSAPTPMKLQSKSRVLSISGTEDEDFSYLPLILEHETQHTLRRQRSHAETTVISEGTALEDRELFISE